MKKIVSITLSFVVLLGLVFLSAGCTQESAYSKKGVVLAWNKPVGEKDIKGYKVYWGFKTNDYKFSIDVGKKTRYFIHQSYLIPGSEYYMTVLAYNSWGMEGYPDEHPLIFKTP